MDKICSKCGKIKDVSFFYRDSGKKDGYKYACKDCSEKDRNPRPERHKEYRIKNKAKVKEYEQKNVHELTDRYLRRILKRQYSITKKEIEQVPILIELKRIEIKNKRVCQKN